VSLQFLLTVVISAILYMNGEDAARWVLRFGRRLAGERGDQVVRLAGQAIRGVALGVVVTALVQSVLGGIGLAIAGIPFAAMLTALMFMLALAQIGPLPVLFGALAWLWWQGHTAWFVALLIWTIVVGSLDNILRPILIRKGADLPLLLIFGSPRGRLYAARRMGVGGAGRRRPRERGAGAARGGPLVHFPIIIIATRTGPQAVSRILPMA